MFENLGRARRRLAFILPVTLALTFAALFSAFGSTIDALLALVNVPFSLVGGVIALYLRGISLSVSAAAGFISLSGIAVMSGLLYISEINRRRNELGEPLEDAVVLGARSQMRRMSGRTAPSGESPCGFRRGRSCASARARVTMRPRLS